MTQYDYDLFVIGGGSGGVRAARMAALAGAKVVLAEEWRMGGTCVIRGCIPKKLLVYASQFKENIMDAAGFGWSFGDCSFDWPTLIANKDKEIARLEDLYTANVEKAGVTIFHDRAVFEDPHTLLLTKSGKRVTAGKILIATGNRPTRDMGTDHAIGGGELCITSDEAFHLKALPPRILIAGGGYIAVEFAHIFHGLGSEVTLVCRRDRPLFGFDEDMREALYQSMLDRGIKVLAHSQFTMIEKRGRCLHVETSKGAVIEWDEVMLAIGRTPNTASLGLQKAGLYLAQLVRMQEEIGTGGGGFRYIYAAFLQEAQAYHPYDELGDISAQFTKAGDMWRTAAVQAAGIYKGRLGSQEDFDQMGDYLIEISELEKNAFLALKKIKWA